MGLRERPWQDELSCVLLREREGRPCAPLRELFGSPLEVEGLDSLEVLRLWEYDFCKEREDRLECFFFFLALFYFVYVLLKVVELLRKVLD